MKKLIFTSLLLLSACSSQQTQDPGYGGGSQYDESRERESARVHTELGAGYYSQGQLAVALEEYGVATRMDSSYGPAFNGLGLVYSALRDDAKAEANFQKSLQLEPQNSDSRNNYGTFLCSRNRIDESIVQFMEAVKNPLYTTPAQAYMNAGVCSLRKKDEHNAEIYFKTALQIQPLLHSAAYQLARLQYSQGQYEQARNTLQYALLNEPNAEILWLAVLLERKSGDRNAEADYAMQLRNKFPTSEQARSLLSGENK